MKLRIQGSSVRLRVSQSELARLIEDGSIENTISLAPDPTATLTYSLELMSAAMPIALAYAPQRISMLVSTAAATDWSTSNKVGIYGTIDSAGGPLELLVEKDFACLDGDEAANADTFPNPNAGSAC
jgi:hypothetical protein